VVDGIDASPSEFCPRGLDRRFGLQHVPPAWQAGIVDLQYNLAVTTPGTLA